MLNAERYHALDALRGFAMFLGVLLHVALSYTETPIDFWPVRDRYQSPVFDFLLLMVHVFRMQLFFLLAGFFGALLYSRYGLIGTARHRLLRVALPLLLAMLTIQPALQAVSVYAASAEHRENPEQPTKAGADFGEVIAYGDTPWEATRHHFTSGSFLDALVPAHLWFLWYLLLLVAVTLPLAKLGDRWKDRSWGKLWDRGARWLFTSPYRWFILTLITWPILLFMATPAGPDTPFYWLPPLHLVVYYCLFFIVGWTLYRQRDLLRNFAAGWRWSLGWAHLVALPMGVTLLVLSQFPHEVNMSDGELLSLLARGPLSLYTWTMIGAMIGLVIRYLSAERRWVRWMSDSAYWCYLASLPPIVLLQLLVKPWEVNAVIKFTVVSAATIALLLVSYQFGVRYTWVGLLLNGRRMERSGPFATPTTLRKSSATV